MRGSKLLNILYRAIQWALNGSGHFANAPFPNPVGHSDTGLGPSLRLIHFCIQIQSWGISRQTLQLSVQLLSNKYVQVNSLTIFDTTFRRQKSDYSS